MNLIEQTVLTRTFKDNRKEDTQFTRFFLEGMHCIREDVKEHRETQWRKHREYRRSNEDEAKKLFSEIIAAYIRCGWEVKEVV